MFTRDEISLIKSRVNLIANPITSCPFSLLKLPKYAEGYVGDGKYMLIIQNKKLVGTIKGDLLEQFADVEVIDVVGSIDRWSSLIIHYLNTVFGKGKYSVVYGFALAGDFFVLKDSDLRLIKTFSHKIMTNGNYIVVHQIL